MNLTAAFADRSMRRDDQIQGFQKPRRMGRRRRRVRGRLTHPDGGRAQTEERRRGTGGAGATLPPACVEARDVLQPLPCTPRRTATEGDPPQMSAVLQPRGPSGGGGLSHPPGAPGCPPSWAHSPLLCSP